MVKGTVTQESSGTELPTGAAEARRLGYKRFYNGNPCKHGHVAERLANNGRCIVCHNEANWQDKQNNPERERAYRERNREKLARQAQQWAERNREKSNQIKKNWDLRNPDKVREQDANWRAANPERKRQNNRRQYRNNREARVESVQKYKRKNRAYFAALQNEREANKKSATPLWADRGDMLVVYEEAKRLTDETDEIYEVDHIVPMQSDIVCGLHVLDNLQVICSSENASKGNRWWPNMPGE